MILSLGSVISCTLFSVLSLLFLFLVYRKTDIALSGGINFLLLGNAIIAIRLLFPIELPFSKTIPCTVILPHISAFINTEIGVGNILIGHIFLKIWMIGIIVKIIYFIVKQYRFKKYLKLLPDISNQNVLKYSMNDIQKKKVKILRSTNAVAPAIVGLFHPVIVLPSYELTKTEISYIIQHEIAHYDRKDLWMKLFIEILCCIYWWNPIMLILREQIVSTFELANDLDMVGQYNYCEKIEYLSCILKVAKESRVKVTTNSLCFVEKKKDLLKKRKISSLLMMSVILTLSVFSFSFSIEPYRISKENVDASVEWSENNTYLVQNNGQYD